MNKKVKESENTKACFCVLKIRIYEMYIKWHNTPFIIYRCIFTQKRTKKIYYRKSVTIHSRIICIKSYAGGDFVVCCENMHVIVCIVSASVIQFDTLKCRIPKHHIVMRIISSTDLWIAVKNQPNLWFNVWNGLISLQSIAVDSLYPFHTWMDRSFFFQWMHEKFCIVEFRLQHRAKLPQSTLTFIKIVNFLDFSRFFSYNHQPAYT